MSNEVEVRIRPEWESESKRLCDWPLDELDRLIRELAQWGFYDGEETRHQVSGEFRWLPLPHFEVIVHTEAA